MWKGRESGAWPGGSAGPLLVAASRCQAGLSTAPDVTIDIDAEATLTPKSTEAPFQVRTGV
jgi:hypothetical protein